MIIFIYKESERRRMLKYMHSYLSQVNKQLASCDQDPEKFKEARELFLEQKEQTIKDINFFKS